MKKNYKEKTIEKEGFVDLKTSTLKTYFVKILKFGFALGVSFVGFKLLKNNTVLFDKNEPYILETTITSKDYHENMEEDRFRSEPVKVYIKDEFPPEVLEKIIFALEHLINK